MIAFFFGAKQGRVLFVGGLLITGLLLLSAILAPVISSSDPTNVSLSQRLLPPLAGEFPLGSDQLGRCVFTRLLYGARITIAATFSILLATISFGTALGGLSGYYGGWLDSGLLKFTDGVMAFPALIIALAITGILGPGLMSVIIALSCVQWVGYYRSVRNLVKSLKERPYIEAAKVCGAGPMAILRGHIIPKVVPFLAIFSTLQFGRIILNISALSFLGLGAQPPFPEWGAMLREAKPYMQVAPHLFFFPGLFIALSVLGMHLIGMGLQKNISYRQKGHY